MKTNLKIFVAVGIILASVVGYSAAQNPLDLSISSNETKIRLAMLKAQLQEITVEEAVTQQMEAQGNLAKGYRVKGADADQTTSELGTFLGNYYSQTAGARSPEKIAQIATEADVRLSALTIAQNQKIIEQNAQVIALLTKIAAKK